MHLHMPSFDPTDGQCLNVNIPCFLSAMQSFNPSVVFHHFPPVRSKLLMGVSRKPVRFKHASGRGNGIKPQPHTATTIVTPASQVPNPLGCRLKCHDSPVPSGIGVVAAAASARRSCGSGTPRVAYRALSVSLSLSPSLSRSLSLSLSVSHCLLLSLSSSLSLARSLSLSLARSALSVSLPLSLSLSLLSLSLSVSLSLSLCGCV